MSKVLVLKPYLEKVGEKSVIRRTIETVEFNESDKEFDSLKFLQKLVNGYIEAVYPEDFVPHILQDEDIKRVEGEDIEPFTHMICFLNEEGKFQDDCYPCLRLEYDIFMGPLVFCNNDGTGKDNNYSLSDEQIKLLKDTFINIPDLIYRKRDE